MPRTGTFGSDKLACLPKTGVLLSTLSLAGCQAPKIDLSIAKVDDDIVVGLKQDWGRVFSDIQAPCVERLRVAKDWSDEAIVWEIRAVPTASSNCRQLSKLIIGKSPSGFAETVPISENTQGEFELIVTGIGTGNTKIELD